MTQAFVTASINPVLLLLKSAYEFFTTSFPGEQEQVQQNVHCTVQLCYFIVDYAPLLCDCVKRETGACARHL